MRDDWSDYLRALGFTEPLMERAEIVVRFYTEIVQIEPAFLFVSEYRDETRRVFDSLWLCNEGTISEARKFATENHFDCIRLRKRIDGWEVRTTNFDWVSPKEDSRLTVNIQLGLGIAGKLQASSDNCAVEALVRPLADAKRLCKSIFFSPRVNGWFTIDQQ